MAFCAECGKSNVEQAVVCDGCGKPMRQAPKGGPARFKGTMIMGGAAPKSPAAAPAPAAAPTPTPAAQPNLAFQATMMGPMTTPGSSAPPPAAGNAVPVTVPATPAAPRVSPKGTMIGGLNAFQIPGPAGHAAAGPTSTATSHGVPTGSAATTHPASEAGHASVLSDPAQPAAAVQPDAPPSLDINYGEVGSYGGYGAGGPSKSNSMLWVGLGIVGAVGFVVVAVGIAVWLGVISF